MQLLQPNTEVSANELAWHMDWKHIVALYLDNVKIALGQCIVPSPPSHALTTNRPTVDFGCQTQASKISSRTALTQDAASINMVRVSGLSENSHDLYTVLFALLSDGDRHQSARNPAQDALPCKTIENRIYHNKSYRAVPTILPGLPRKLRLFTVC